MNAASAEVSGAESTRASTLPLVQLTRALSYAILLGGGITIFVSAYMVVATYSSLPYWDGWRQIDVAANGFNPLNPSWLWAQHNEHRLVLPKIFLAIDLRFFQARQNFLLTSIFAIQLAHLALLSWSLRALGSWKGDLWRTGTGLAAFCLFCPSQNENFIWGFQVCFVLPLFFATLCFAALSLYASQEIEPGIEDDAQQRPAKRPSRALLVISILGALAAAYSLANGNLLWPLILAGAVFLRLRFRVVLAIAAAGIASTALYFYQYARPEGHASPIASLAAPLQLLKYCATYFFSAWPHYGPPWLWILWLAALLLLLPVLTYVREFRALAVPLVLTIFYCLATALVTSAGRVNFGIAQAATSRYQSVALLFWCCLGLLLLGGAFAARRRSPSWFLAAQLFLLAVFIQGAFRSKDPISDARMHAFAQNTAAAALLTGVSDSAAFNNVVYPEPGVFPVTIPYMRANRLSVFSDSTASVLERTLESEFPLSDSVACFGTIEDIVPVRTSAGPALGPGLRMIGSAWDRRSNQAPAAIVITNDGKIVGLGATGGPRPQDQNASPRRYRFEGFVAFLPPLPRGSTANFYAILRGSSPSACLIRRLAVD